jgi:anti-sigma regulatory factor (Ser/Thr protein kinase)
LRQKLEEWLAAQGVSASERFDVLLAGSEAFANAVEHPFAARGGGRRVLITCPEESPRVSSRPG